MDPKMITSPMKRLERAIDEKMKVPRNLIVHAVYAEPPKYLTY